MSGSQTGAKLTDSLRRAKTQQDTPADPNPAPETQAIPSATVAPKVKSAPRKATSRPVRETRSSGFVMSSRCWPD